MPSGPLERAPRLIWFVAALTLVAALNGATPAWAWERPGHRLTARIAERHLPLKVKAATSIAGSPLWTSGSQGRPSRTCRPVSAGSCAPSVHRSRPPVTISRPGWPPHTDSGPGPRAVQSQSRSSKSLPPFRGCTGRCDRRPQACPFHFPSRMCGTIPGYQQDVLAAGVNSGFR
jgi:hypothetical protein